MPGRNTNMQNLHVQNSKTNSLNHNLQKFICIHSHTHPSIRRNPWPLCIQFYDFVLWCCHKYLRKLEGKRTDSSMNPAKPKEGKTWKNGTVWERWSDSSELALGRQNMHFAPQILCANTVNFYASWQGTSAMKSMQHFFIRLDLFWDVSADSRGLTRGLDKHCNSRVFPIPCLPY